MTPSTLKGWLRSRMICPVGSSSGPNSVSETTVPSTATFCAPVTSAEVKKLPYFVGQLRMSGRSTSVPCTLVDQFWLPAMTCERLLAPAAAYCTPGIALIIVASAGVIVVALPWPMRTPPEAKLPALTMIMLVPADLTRSSMVVRAPVRDLLIDLDPAVAELHEAGAVLGDVHFVGDEHDGDAALEIQLLEDVHDLDARPRIEVPGRLVRQQDRRLVDQRARDGDALLLAARQLVGIVIHALAEADDLEDLFGAAMPLGGLHLRRPGVVEQQQLDVVERRRPRQQVEALEHEADLLVPDDGELVLGQLRHVLAVEEVLPAGRPIEAADDVHEGRLAGARRSGHGDELAATHIQRGAAQRPHFDVADLVGLRQVANRHDDVGVSHQRPPPRPPPPPPPPGPPGPPGPRPRWAGINGLPLALFGFATAEAIAGVMMLVTTSASSLSSESPSTSVKVPSLIPRRRLTDLSCLFS